MGLVDAWVMQRVYVLYVHAVCTPDVVFMYFFFRWFIYNRGGGLVFFFFFFVFHISGRPLFFFRMSKMQLTTINSKLCR